MQAPHLPAPPSRPLLGRAVHQHEMIWVQAANGRWVLVEALLDSGNNGECHSRVLSAPVH